MKLIPSRTENRVLAAPATVAACQADRAEHTPQREAQAVEQLGQARASAQSGPVTRRR